MTAKGNRAGRLTIIANEATIERVFSPIDDQRNGAAEVVAPLKRA